MAHLTDSQQATTVVPQACRNCRYNNDNDNGDEVNTHRLLQQAVILVLDQLVSSASEIGACSPSGKATDSVYCDLITNLKQTLMYDHTTYCGSQPLESCLHEIKAVAKYVASSMKINNTPNWGNLPKELVTKIVEHVDSYEDFETLHCICSPWRSAAKEAVFQGFCISNNNNNVGEPSSSAQKHKLPWLMIPNQDNNLSHRICLYSLSKNMIRPIDVPDSLMDVDCNDGINRLISSFGWLLLMSRRLKPCLFNPVSKVVIELPKIKHLNHAHESMICRYHKFTLSANPSTTSDYVVFLSLMTPLLYRIPSLLVYWKNGNDGWITVVKHPHHNYFSTRFLDYACRDITFYQGEFYGVNVLGTVVKFETRQGSPYYQLVTNLEPRCRRFYDWYYYLVESTDGQLLAIRQGVKKNLYHSWLRTTGFKVFELDLMTGKLINIVSLGNTSIFVGSNSSFSMKVSPDDHGFKPNSIYNTDDPVTWKSINCKPDCKETCLYNITDGKIDRFYRGPSLLSGCLTPFMWVESP